MLKMSANLVHENRKWNQESIHKYQVPRREIAKEQGHSKVSHFSTHEKEVGVWKLRYIIIKFKSKPKGSKLYMLLKNWVRKAIRQSFFLFFHPE
jgi:hypothetical protein